MDNVLLIYRYNVSVLALTFYYVFLCFSALSSKVNIDDLTKYLIYTKLEIEGHVLEINK